MKQAVLALVIILVTTFNLGAYTYSFNQQDVAISTKSRGNTEYSVVRFNNLISSGEPGKPELPVKTVNLIIPVNSEISSITVNSDLEELSGLFLVAPAQPETVNGQAPQFVEPDANVYGSATPFPANIVKTVSYGYYDGCNKIASISISPLQYRPSARKLILHKNITFTFNFRSSTDKTVQPAYRLAKDATVYNHYFNQIVDNYSEKQFSPPVVSYNQAVDLNLYNYLILVPPGYKEAFKEFKAWKEEKGNLVKIVSYDEISNTGDDLSAPAPTITDKAGQIRKYLSTEYSTGALAYVLLVGDEGNFTEAQRPTRRALVGSKPLDDGDYSPSDLYFSDFNGNWDSDNDGIFAESPWGFDMASEIYVGRLIVPYNYTDIGSQQVKNWTAKLIGYEQNPGLGNRDYLKSLFFCQTDQFEKMENPVLPVKDFIENQGFSLKYVKDGEDGIAPSGLSVIGMMEGKGLVFFDGHGLKNKIGTANINNGIPHYLNIPDGSNNTPFGFTYGINSLDCYNDESVFKEDGNGFDNLFVNYQYQIAWSNSCESAAFQIFLPRDGNNALSMAEAFTTATGQGYCGPAYIGSTGLTPMNCYPWILRDNFFHLMFANNAESSYSTKKLGSVLSSTKSAQNNFYFAPANLVFNLIGDPEMDFWTDIPADLTTVLSGSTVSVLSFKQAGIYKPVADAVVMAYNGSRYYEILTDLDGKAILPFPATALKSFTVSKPSWLPVRNTVINSAINTDFNYAPAGDLVITSTGVLKLNAFPQLAMQPGSKIVIQNGGYLDFSNGGTIKCAVEGFNWQGIEATSGSKLELHGVTIKNAVTALSGSPAVLCMQNCTVSECQNGLNLLNCQNGYSITGSVFNGVSQVNSCGILATQSAAGSFYNNTVRNFSIGISLLNAPVVMRNNLITKNSRYGIYSSGLNNSLNLYADAANVKNNEISQNGSTANDAQIYVNSGNLLLDNGFNHILYNRQKSAVCISKPVGLVWPNSRTLPAKNNYWGESPNNSFFYPTTGWITYTPYWQQSITTETTQSKELLKEAINLENEQKYPAAISKMQELTDNYPDSLESYAALNLLYKNYQLAGLDLGTLDNFYGNIANNDSWQDKDFITEAQFRSYLTAQNCTAAQNLAEVIKESADNNQEKLLAELDMLLAVELSDGKGLGEQREIALLVNRMRAKELTAQLLYGNETADQNSACQLPQTTRLLQNYPNPFNNSTIVNYQLAVDGIVKLTVYNSKGEMVKTLLNGVQTAGSHQVKFDGNSLNSGVYFYRLETADKSIVNKMLMLK